ncbi:MAG: hypothetical protein BWX92_03488 [Deltaproteobacteria bacterium ADurb.Bin135]|nr:MAG: hypothetical protein BWX92_03488 [Deltaproteobacteria bacterium ADurb.Bin135]
MSNMTTLGNVFNRVHEMSQHHHDKFIEVKEISFESLETISISDELHRLKPIAQMSISNRLGIPFHYLRKCPSDIQRLNLNHWLQYERNEELFFRFNGDDVRAIFTPRYIPTDNIEVLDKLKSLDYPFDTRVQSSIDDEFMMINIPDGRQSFTINGERMTPGISVSNSEVGLASLSIAAFVLRLVCTNGMISKTEVSASYRHISGKILSELPKVLTDVSSELGKKKDQFRLSIESKVEHPEMTINSFNNQFQLNKEEKEAVEWAMPLEYGQTMFHVINVYTKAAQYPELPADSGYKLQKVGGMILEMVK